MQLTDRFSTGPALYAFLWWAWMELNHRPHAYQACALTELSYRPSVIPLLATLPTPVSLFQYHPMQAGYQIAKRAYYSFVREQYLISQN